MAAKVRNRPLPIHGRERPQAGRSLSAVYLAASRAKTRLPKIEWSSTRVGEVGPAGPTRQLSPTTTARVMVSLPFRRGGRAAPQRLEPGAGEEHGGQQPLPEQQLPAGQVVEELDDVHHASWSAGHGDLGGHARVDAAEVVEAVADGQAELAARVDYARVDPAGAGRDRVGGGVLVVEHHRGPSGHGEGPGDEGQPGH